MVGVRLLVQFTANNAELAESHVQAVVNLCKIVQQEPGCLQFEVFRNALRPEQYAVLEHWASQQALDERRKRMPPPGAAPAGITRTREIYTHDEVTQAAHQPSEPGSPLNGPISSEVSQPP